MTVETQVLEAKKGMDALLPQIPETLKPSHTINVTVPEPRMKLEFPEYSWGPIDSIASVAMAIGLITLGYFIRAVLG